jgi:hypothetical protein
MFAVLPLPDWVPPAHGFWERPSENAVWTNRLDFIDRLTPCEGVRRLIGCAFTRAVLRLLDAAQPGDDRPRATIGVAERFAFGLAGRGELAAAAGTATLTTYVATIAPADYVTATSATTAAVFSAVAAVFVSVNLVARASHSNVLRAAEAVRLNQARILTMFQPAPWSERARAIGQRWVETYWEYGDDRLTRLVLSDLLEEEGWDGQGHMVRALRELPVGQYLLGYGPMIPDQDEGG